MHSTELRGAAALSKQAVLAMFKFAAAAAFVGGACAADFIDARDGDTALAKMSMKDQTRIKLDKGRIVDVIGDVYDREKNPAGRLVVVPDAEDGEIYVRPVDSNPRPVKVDLRTDRGKFSLLLEPVDIPGDTVILRPRGPALPKGSGAGAAQAADAGFTAGLPVQVQSTGAPLPRTANHVRTLKAITLAMAGTEVPADVEVRPVNQVVTLWREARFVQLATYLSRDLVGERYELTNVSENEMVIDERELYRDGVQSVSVQFHRLRPGTKTAVWIVRARADND